MAAMLEQQGQGDRVSRPTSLLLDGAQPEREPLKFDVQLVGAPPEVEQLVNNIKQVAEDFLYHWKTFPIGKEFCCCCCSWFYWPNRYLTIKGRQVDVPIFSARGIMLEVDLKRQMMKMRRFFCMFKNVTLARHFILFECRAQIK